MGKANTEMTWTESKQPDHKELYMLWQDAMLCFKDKENKHGKVERQMASSEEVWVIQSHLRDSEKLSWNSDENYTVRTSNGVHISGRNYITRITDIIKNVSLPTSTGLAAPLSNLTMSLWKGSSFTLYMMPGQLHIVLFSSNRIHRLSFQYLPHCFLNAAIKWIYYSFWSLIPLSTPLSPCIALFLSSILQIILFPH